jgi:hypothetical protein
MIMRGLSLALFVLLFSCSKKASDSSSETTPIAAGSTTAAPAIPDQPEPKRTLTLLAKLSGAAVGIALSGDRLFVTAEDDNDPNETAEIVQIPITGGEPRSIARKQRGGQAPVVAQGYLYWLASGDSDRGESDAVMQVPLGGGQPKRLARAFQFGDGDLATDGKFLFFVDHVEKAEHPLRVARMPLDGHGKAEFFAPTDIFHTKGAPQGSVHAITVDATHLYWVTDSVIFRAPLSDGSSAQRMARGTNIWGLASDGTHLYWTDKGETSGPGAGVVNRMPIDGGPTETIASGYVYPWGIATDSEAVYWVANADKKGSVMKFYKATRRVVMLAADQDAPVHLVLNEKYVFWTNAGSHTVCRIEK